MAGPICRSCGHRNEPSANFCSSCGASQAGVDDDTSQMPVDSLNELLASDNEPEPGDSPYLVVRHGPMSGARFALDRTVVSAGRHPDSDIFLDDVTVSRRHAQFARRSGATRVSDAGSLNGTYVNRRLVDGDVDLSDRDEVQIGKFKLVYLDRAPDSDG